MLKRLCLLSKLHVIIPQIQDISDFSNKAVQASTHFLANVMACTGALLARRAPWIATRRHHIELWASVSCKRLREGASVGSLSSGGSRAEPGPAALPHRRPFADNTSKRGGNTMRMRLMYTIDGVVRVIYRHDSCRLRLAGDLMFAIRRTV